MRRARKLPFALKVIDTSKLKGREEAIENEVAILRRLKNRNIVQLIEEFHTPSATFLVMELVTVRRRSIYYFVSYITIYVKDCFSDTIFLSLFSLSFSLTLSSDDLL